MSFDSSFCIFHQLFFDWTKPSQVVICIVTFAAHSRHEATLIATILASDSSLFSNITIPITLTSKSWLSIFCTSNVKALQKKRGKNEYNFFTYLILLKYWHGHYKFLQLAMCWTMNSGRSGILLLQNGV